MLAAALVTSCSDFDDYNTAPVDATASANETLWENISSNSQLSDFVALLTRAGFADDLDAAHYYTVWAPVNGSFDASAYSGVDSTELLREFVKNHIAEYSHSAVGEIDERVHTLNEKSYDFEGSGSYTFGDVALTEINLPSNNGLLHLLGGMVDFYPNIYEYLDKVEGCDSVVSNFKYYESTYLDEENSVIGPVENGMQTYIDSVMVTVNSLTNQMRVYLDNEDSVYTMLFPTDDAWNGAYARIKPYYNYRATTSAQDLENATSASVAPTISQTIDNSYYTDSLAKRYIERNIIFNNNDYYNRWVEDETAFDTDTISTVGGYLSNPDEVLARTTIKERMSNGYARIVDSLAFRSWDTYSPELNFSASSSVGAVWNGTETRENVTVYSVDSLTNESEVDTTLTYIHVTPSSNYSRPELDLYLPNVRSTTYHIYLEMIPAYDSETDLAAAKPNQLDFTLSYCNANGTVTSLKLNQQVENDASKIDTIYVGEITFPICYYGLDVSPNLKITSDFSTFNSTAMAKYTRDIRIGRVILKPTELEEYEANN